MNYYDEAYKSKEYYWGESPSEMCEKILSYIPPIDAPSVLDIGCGEGKDAVFFAKCGYKVDAFDKSSVGIQKLKTLAVEKNIIINSFVSNIMSYEPIKQYDVLYCSGVLHYIEPTLVKTIIDRYKSCVKKNGIVAFNVFVKKPFISPSPEIESAYLWKSGELLSYFSDWFVENYSEVIIDCNSSDIAHKHALNILYARNIG